MKYPRTDPERQEIANDAAELAGYYSAVPHTISHLRAAIDSRIPDGLASAAYDTEGGRSTTETFTNPEKALLGGHREGCIEDQCTCDERLVVEAMESLGDLDHALALYRQGNEIMRRLRNVFPIYEYVGPARPGIDPCPIKHCVDHWEAGFRTRSAKGKYAEYCRRCGDHRNERGASIPPLVLQAAEATRPLSADDKVDWQHWTVRRAWQQVGGQPARLTPPGDKATAEWESVSA
jgi:hypothetical protein